MKLLPLLWLLCGLLLVVGDQDPPVAPAPKAPIADNSTVAAQGKPTSPAASSSGATGTPLPPAGSAAAGKVQTSDQSAPKTTKLEPQQPAKEANKTTAASENAGKNRGRTDTGSPKAAGETPVAATTAKPAVVESKASTAAAGAGAAAAASPPPPVASPKPKANDTAPVLSTSTKASTSTTTTTTAKPAAGSAIVADGQTMKDVTKPTNSKGNSTTNSSTTSTMASTKTTVKTTLKPTKPPVVYSMGTHSEWEKDQVQGKDGDKKPPLPKPVSTLSEPVTPQVQELTGNLSDRGNTGYVVPIVTVLLTVPLAIGVVTIMYRRFRDMWSTRHYRRMDFLVDGMYND